MAELKDKIMRDLCDKFNFTGFEIYPDLYPSVYGKVVYLKWRDGPKYKAVREYVRKYEASGEVYRMLVNKLGHE